MAISFFTMIFLPEKSRSILDPLVSPFALSDDVNVPLNPLVAGNDPENPDVKSYIGVKPENHYTK